MATRRANTKVNQGKLARTLLVVIFVLIAIALVSFFINKDKPATTETIQINEVMAGNKQAVTDEEGNYSDWIELYNPGTTAVSLSGWGFRTASWSRPNGPSRMFPFRPAAILWCIVINRTSATPISRCTPISGFPPRGKTWC